MTNVIRLKIKWSRFRVDEWLLELIFVLKKEKNKSSPKSLPTARILPERGLELHKASLQSHMPLFSEHQTPVFQVHALSMFCKM